MRNQPILILIATVLLLNSIPGICAEDTTLKDIVNSIGVHMVPIPAGEFRMGILNPTVPDKLDGPPLLFDGDWDERPVRKVKISSDFLISKTEITIEQFKLFQPDFNISDRFAPYVSNLPWERAVAFCEWLSEKEGKSYRLPTEAECEYACRAGTETQFWSGNEPPSPGTANPWGLINMHTPPLEWCLDWHAMYPDVGEIDPVGPATGVARVARGGGIQKWEAPYYRRSANRASLPPHCPVQYKNQDVNTEPTHPIGFRIVMAPFPKTAPCSVEKPFVQQCVKQYPDAAEYGPDEKQPYFKIRPLLPIPPENDHAQDRAAVGLHPALLAHNHSPGMTVCSNGDVLACFFTASTSTLEYKPNVCLIQTRLRCGAEQWDMPELYYDFADAAEQCALIWNDNDRLFMFTGGVGLPGVPFRWCTSDDNGATWSEQHFPVFDGPIGPHSPQPINSAFRDAEGTIYVASDGDGGTSLLWASRNEGKTWFDTGGRTGGRHTTFTVLKDGGILGMGGKNTDIEGYMPKSISLDCGKSYEISKTPFPALAFNQRPSLIRLQSGRLFFAGDFQSTKNKKPDEIKEKGAYVALSDDEGQTWHIKKIEAAQPHESHIFGELGEHWNKTPMTDATWGYSVAAQAPNGVIHLITTMNHPCLHLEMNEAWILADLQSETAPKGKGIPMKSKMTLEEFDSENNLKARWSVKLAADGRYILDGNESWFYPDGSPHYEVKYENGIKTGTEIYRTMDGRVLWEWEHRPDGIGLWTQYWSDGKKKAESSWRNFRAHGPAIIYDRNGNQIQSVQFENGILQN